MTPNQINNSIDHSSEKNSEPNRFYRKKYILYLAIIVLVCNGFAEFFHSHFPFHQHQNAANGQLVTFNVPAGAYHLRYDPTIFQHVLARSGVEVETFVSKGGHASFNISTIKNSPLTFVQIFGQDEDSYRTQVPSVFLTGRNFRPDHFVITARSFNLRGNQYDVERALLRGGVVYKLRIQYDDECDSACEAVLRQTAESFSNSSPN